MTTNTKPYQGWRRGSPDPSLTTRIRVHARVRLRHPRVTNSWPRPRGGAHGMRPASCHSVAVRCVHSAFVRSSTPSVDLRPSSGAYSTPLSPLAARSNSLMGRRRGGLTAHGTRPALLRVRHCAARSLFALVTRRGTFGGGARTRTRKSTRAWTWTVTSTRRRRAVAPVQHLINACVGVYAPPAFGVKE